ncbi:MAG: response regulator [Desulfuromonadaceae bacterium]
MKQRVLIVDDSPSALKILNDALRHDYQISAATSGAEALALAASQSPDLILLDIKMPDLDGYEVCRRLKQAEATRDIPVLFVTILGEIEDETKGLALGAVDYITKPISPAIVQARVRNHIRLKMHQDHLEEMVRERTRELTEARAQAERANRLKDEFIVNISHEIRSPLNAILGMTDLLRETELEPKQQEYLRMAADSATQLLGLLTDLLDFSNIETGKLDFEKIDFNLRQSFEPMLAAFAGRAEQKSLHFKCQVEPEVPESLQGDPDRLRQLVNNLLNNALKFTPHGSIELRCALEKEEPGENDSPDLVTLKFSVQDTGIGIPPEQQKHIFEHFYQVDGSLTRSRGGTGMGLAINQKLVERMGGRIWVESEPGRGSCFHFTVRLPRSLPVTTAESKTAAASEKTRRILVVEDNQANRRLLQLVLENNGFQVATAENGALALEVLRQTPADLILMDIQMPEMDGLTATQKIRQTTDKDWATDIPIIALTAHARLGDRQKYLDAGMNDYLGKPFRFNTLLEKISRLLTQHAA